MPRERVLPESRCSRLAASQNRLQGAAAVETDTASAPGGPPLNFIFKKQFTKTALTFQCCHSQHWSHSKNNGFSPLRRHTEELGRPGTGGAGGAGVFSTSGSGCSYVPSYRRL